MESSGGVEHRGQAPGTHADAPGHDASTRDRVARSILEHGPSTAAELAERLTLTPAAVRRHLAVLLGGGQIVARERRVYGARGRGRPAKVFALTDAGRQQFYQSYDRLAVRALHFLRSSGGEAAVQAFAEDLWRDVADEFRSAAGDDTASRTEVLAEVLNRQGFVASLHPVRSGQQLCQYHCPVAHVAAEFPELCAAETKVFGELLDSHVQRIATIAHADGVCTTHIPHPVSRKVSR